MQDKIQSLQEMQLEIDRRLVSDRKVALRRELEGIQARRRREVYARKQEHFTVGLVGYTNAGKSTLFNTLTAGGAYADDRLFATLTTRTREWKLSTSEGQQALSVMLSDTVGFVRDIPTHLVASFKATLEEATHADVLLIMLDVSDPAAEIQYNTVQRVLDELNESDQASIRELARNPLLLTLLCLAYEATGSLPARRVAIYREAVDALLKKWDASRAIQRPTQYGPLTLGLSARSHPARGCPCRRAGVGGQRSPEGEAQTPPSERRARMPGANVRREDMSVPEAGLGKLTQARSMTLPLRAVCRNDRDVRFSSRPANGPARRGRRRSRRRRATRRSAATGCTSRSGRSAMRCPS